MERKSSKCHKLSNKLQVLSKSKQSAAFCFSIGIKQLVEKQISEWDSLLWTIYEGPGKRGHIVVDTLLPMMFSGLRKLGNICCRHKICVRNRCCAHGQTGKHLCQQQCVRNNVSSFARAFRYVQSQG